MDNTAFPKSSLAITGSIFCHFPPIATTHSQLKLKHSVLLVIKGG